MPQSASIELRVRAARTLTTDLGSESNRIEKVYSRDLTNGTGVNQASNLWSDTRSLGSGANEDIDLAGVLTGPSGAVLTFTAVKFLAIVASSANTVNLTVTRPASNGAPIFLAAGDGIVLPPGGMFVYEAPSAAGVAITAGTGDLLNILSGAAISAYDIIVIGNA